MGLVCIQLLLQSSASTGCEHSWSKGREQQGLPGEKENETCEKE